MVDIFCLLEYIERNSSRDYTHWNIVIISYEICIAFPSDENRIILLQISALIQEVGQLKNMFSEGPPTREKRQVLAPVE